jgi:aryl-alcohol dehydrogenase-like predicted oxidoreductase
MGCNNDVNTNDLSSSLPEICLGAWAWGNDGTFGGNLTSESLRPIFDKAMENGLNLWDTAFAYGMGASEKTLASFIKDLPREKYLISDKFTPQCIDSSAENPFKEMIEKQLNLMNLSKFDIYWIHNVAGAPKWIEELAKYFQNKKPEEIPLIGVSNHNLSEIKQAVEILGKYNLKLSAVQNHYSLLNRSSEKSGILKYCHENNIHFFSYMVLEQGALSGKYNSQNLMPENSERGKIYNPQMEKIEKLNNEMKKLADKYKTKIALIPIAWAIKKGTLPIIGVTKTEQVEDAVAATKINLTKDEISGLENFANQLDINVIRFWEKEMK